MVKEVTSNEEFKAVLNSGKTVIVDWSATWCGPCKMISPVFNSLSEEFTSMTFVKVDVDVVPEAAEAADVTAMPTFHVYQAGEKVDQVVGANQAKLRDMVAKYNK
ncbi:thioredoxin [Chytriomyces sp. MP71]|nr:thioredoxin [Chytriomyces sp. MP71]